MMLPARAAWPPNNFTPRRLLSLSRPLRDEPPAFLCAMSNYFAFGDFLAAPLAGAAFSVEAPLAVLPPLALFLAPAGPSALLGTGFAFRLPGSAGGLAAASLFGAGFGVSWAGTSGAATASAAFGFVAFAGAAEAVTASAPVAAVAALALAGFSAFTSPIATMRRIVCCWRCP